MNFHGHVYTLKKMNRWTFPHMPVSKIQEQSVEHYNGVIMSVMGSQITSLTIVYSTVHSGADQRTHQSSGSLAFVRGIQRSPAGNAENVSIWSRHQTGRNYRSYVHDLQGKAANVNLGAIRVNSIFYWLTAEINIWHFILSAHHKAPYLMFPNVHSRTIFLLSGYG